ncbi:2-oxo acid dehydrogenase subunit E2, partial [Sulfitobacter sp.]|uniref:2-oxo acid dehydrogenase subunit E2 n=1 Tax=Sulfitobacter sp. TaxID=1903071 RepID=UPI0035646E41
MPIEILMPALSPTMEEGTLAKWLVKEGDTVSSGDVMCEIETDKATMEFEATDEGVIGKILIADGTEGVKVNTPIAVLLEDGESKDDIGAASAPAAAAPAPAAQEASAPAAAPTAPAAPKSGDGTRIFATPLARRIAADKGLDLAQVKGSGPHGRIVKADVEGLSKSDAPKAASTAAPTTAAAKPALAAGPSADAVMKMYEGREYEEITLNGMRKTIASRLTEAKQSIPHFYLRRDIQLDALMAFRADLNKQLEARGVKLSVNDFIIKACALALQAVPDANAVWAGDRILKLKPSDVAVAVAIDGGLFTPVLTDSENKSLSVLSAEMKDLATRARDRKLAPHEYQGGSFAISNLGMFGIDN